MHSISRPIDAGTPPSFGFVQALAHIWSGPNSLAFGSAALTASVSVTAAGEASAARKKQSAPCAFRPAA